MYYPNIIDNIILKFIYINIIILIFVYMVVLVLYCYYHGVINKVLLTEWHKHKEGQTNLQQTTI